GRRVHAAPARGHRADVRGDGNERLARAGRGGEDDVRAAHELHDGLVLRRVEREALAARPAHKRVVDLIGGGVGAEDGSGHALTVAHYAGADPTAGSGSAAGAGSATGAGPADGFERRSISGSRSATTRLTTETSA